MECNNSKHLETDDIGTVYQKRIDCFSSILNLLNKKISYISNIRLITVILTIVASVYFYKQGLPHFFSFSIVCGIVAFILLALYHEKLHFQKKRNEILVGINSRCAERLLDKWHNYHDNGSDFIDKGHACSTDLDIFGDQSLYQWLTAAHTFYGRKILANDLIIIPVSPELIIERQNAIQECESLLDFRQNFEAIASEQGMQKDQSLLLAWAEEPSSHYYLSLFHLIKILPFFLIAAGLASVILFKLPIIAYLICVVNISVFATFYFHNKKFMDRFEKNGKTILAFADLMQLVQKTTFNSNFLKICRSKIVETEEQSSAFQMKKLASIVSSMEVRYSPLGHFFANILLLWDLRVRVNAEKWRNCNGKNVRVWLEQIGIIEAIISFASVTYEHPDWAFPSINNKNLHINAKHAGHPLIPQRDRVYNDFEFSNGKIAIITGSNMSGKSTFLRTVGINSILAYAGASVCATSMSCSIVNIFTSMRIEDNLTNKVSTFYAELIRIKNIILANSKGIPLLFLLDELFRGTNSEDRYEGAVAVLKRLKNSNTVGIISTHDLQLCKLGEEPLSGFCNFHFREYYDGKEIRFDYKLNNGPSTTKNAMFLLKMLEIT